MIRTHDAGALRADHVGQSVTLAGWVARRRDHGGVAFLDLREASGVVQVVVRDEDRGPPAALGVLRPGHRRGLQPPRGQPEPEPAHRRDRGHRRRGRDPRRLDAPLPFPIDDHVEVGEEVRLAHRYLDLRRSGPAAAIRLRSKVNHAARDGAARPCVRRGRDPDADPLHPRGRPRLPGAGAPAAGQLVRPSPEPAAVQAAAHGRRHGALLPDRALLPRRGLPRRPAAGVHPARHRDVLRRPGRRHRAGRGGAGRAVAPHRSRDQHTDPADDLRRGDAPLRQRQARPALCPASSSSAPSSSPTPPSACSRRRTSARSSCPVAPAQPRKQLDAWQEWAKQRGARGLAYLLVKEDGELTGPVAKNISDEERAGIAAHVGAQPGDCIFFGAGAPKSSRALLGAARLEIGRRAGLIDESAWEFLWVVDAPLFEPADEATAAGDVAVGSGAWTAVHHAFTVPQARVARHLRHRPRQRAGVRLRHRLQRQRDRWRVDPYPPRGRPEARLRDHGAQRGGGRREVRLPARRPSSSAPRRTAASPSVGTGSARCCRERTRSATSSPSPRAGEATTR